MNRIKGRTTVKKVYYDVTEKDKEVYAQRETRDDGWKQKNHAFLNRLTSKEMQNAARYLRQYNDFLEQVIKQEVD